MTRCAMEPANGIAKINVGKRVEHYGDRDRFRWHWPSRRFTAPRFLSLWMSRGIAGSTVSWEDKVPEG